MPHSVLVPVLLWLSIAPASADPAVATAQLRTRFQSEWRELAGAPKAVDWRITYGGKRLTGDWVVTLGAYRYFIEHGKIRCQVQQDKYMSCGGGESVEPRWTATATSRRVNLATMKMLRRALFGTELNVIADTDARGHAIVETLVVGPDAELRTSERYRANVDLSAESFTLGQPLLVEQFRETCVAISGCHSMHWNCFRQ